MESSFQYQNPLISGFAPDPSVVLVDGVFFLVTSSFHVFPGLPIYASEDLKTWVHIGNAVNRPGQLSLAQATTRAFKLDTGNTMVATGGLFAPTIRYHGGKFYIICTNCVSSDGSTDTQNFIIQTSDIWGGSWSDPVAVDFHGIDPSLFFDDDDGKVYFQGCFVIDRSRQPSCTIKQFEIDVETGEQLSEQREIWGGYAKYDTEGPHIYKKDGWYYLLVAEGGTFEHHMLSIARSRDVWGPYESFAGNPVMTADGKDEYIQNIGHGELFQDAKGQWWAAVLGVRNDEGCAALGRESFLTSVEWPQEGWPRIAQPKIQFERGLSLEHDLATAKLETKKLESPPHVGDVYIRDPDLSKYRLSDSDNGSAVLLPSHGGLASSTGTCTFLGRRQKSLGDTAVARLELTQELKSSRGVQAGLAMYRDHVRHVSIVYDPETKTVSCHAVNSVMGLDRRSLTQLPVSQAAQAIWMKVQASAKEWKFLAKIEQRGGVGSGKTREWVLLDTVRVAELDARDFTGPIIGVYAQSESEDETTEVNFSKFTVRAEGTSCSGDCCRKVYSDW